MDMHKLITELAPVLGYADVNDGGTCHGFTLRWLEACILDEEAIFEARVNRIAELSLVAMIESIKDNR